MCQNELSEFLEKIGFVKSKVSWSYQEEDPKYLKIVIYLSHVLMDVFISDISDKYGNVSGRFYFDLNEENLIDKFIDKVESSVGYNPKNFKSYLRDEKIGEILK